MKSEPSPKKARLGKVKNVEDDDDDKSVVEVQDPVSPFSYPSFPCLTSPQAEYLVARHTTKTSALVEKKGSKAPDSTVVNKALGRAFRALANTNFKAGASPVFFSFFYPSLTPLSERVNVDLDSDAQVFLQLVTKTPGHAYTFRSGLGNSTRHRHLGEEAEYEPKFKDIPLIDVGEISDLSFSNAQIVSPLSHLMFCADFSIRSLAVHALPRLRPAPPQLPAARYRSLLRQLYQ